MAGLQWDADPVIQDFHAWYRRAGQKGKSYNISQLVDCTFIPEGSVRAYLGEENRVQRLIEAIFPDPDSAKLPEAETIRKSHLNLFCILLCIGKGHFINHFVENRLYDSTLPYTVRPTNFPYDSNDSKFWESFFKRQWEFSARKFTYNTNEHLDAEQWILPFTQVEKIGEGGSAMTYKVELHEQYDDLVLKSERNNPNPHTYVLKTYRKIDAYKYYNNEVSAFKRFRRGAGGPHPDIVGFYGSFILAGTYNTLLEYADMGTLEDYFKSNPGPSSGEEIANFWDGLLKIFSALETIHGTGEKEENGPIVLNGWHQDVKPNNILVMSKLGKSKYEPKIMIADLGTSHFRKKMEPLSIVKDKNAYGTRAYGAPECYRPEKDIEKQSINVQQNVDIWSAGCVLSEAAVWVVYGYSGLEQYRMKRRFETDSIPGFTDSGCFHDGVSVLEAVKDTHRSILSRHDVRKSDHVTKEVLDMINYMLVQSHGRPQAQVLRVRSENIIAQARKTLGENSSEKTLSSGIVKSPDSMTASTDSQLPPELPDGYNARSKSQNRDLILRTHTVASVNTASEFLRPSRYTISGSSHNPLNTDQDIDPSDEVETLEAPSLDRVKGKRPLSDAFIKKNATEPQWSGINDKSVASHPFGSDPSRRQVRSASPASNKIVEGHVGSLFKSQDTSNVNSEARTPFPFPPPPGSRASSRSPQPRDQLQDDSVKKNIPISYDPPPYLSVQDALKWRNQKKELGWNNPETERLLGPMKDRDFAFLVDDSASMKAHWGEVIKIFGLLSYMVKRYDRDGIDLHLTMSSKTWTSKKTTKLIEILKDRKDSLSGKSDLKDRLGTMLEQYTNKLNQSQSSPNAKKLWAKRLRRYNIYVLTDAIWQPYCDPAPLIRTMVGTLENLKLHNAQIGIQFIRFGHDKDGIERLERLDSGLGFTPEQDIVDTEPANGNVYKMLLGAINPWFDGDNVKPNGDEAGHSSNSGSA